MRGEGTDRLADRIERHGLAAPAHLLLAAHRPLRPLLAEAGAFLAPMLRPLLGPAMADAQRTLDDDEAYNALVARLETPTREADGRDR